MSLFENYSGKGLELKNRVVMAPMTRARNPNGIPNDLNALYYQQRTGAGLIITEGTAISPTSMGVLHVPGLFTKEQVEDTKIFTQLWHVGRVSHVSNQPDRQAPVGASAKQAAESSAWGYDEQGKESFVIASKPHPLTSGEVKQVVKDFANAAANAVEAGFDGVELHGANGYLIEQFLNPFINDRTDEYGGSIVNRSRFLLEAIDASIAEIGAEKVAIRLTPYGGLHELPHYDEIDETYAYLASELGKRGIVYIHMMDQKSRGSFALPDGFLKRFRANFNGIIILAGGMDKELSEKYIAEGLIDLAAFGEAFIANPDLTDRLKYGYELALSNRDLHYGGAAHGYTDYPVYAGNS